MKQLRRGYPYLELSFVWIIVLSTSLAISSLYLFLYYMIEDFGMLQRRKDFGALIHMSYPFIANLSSLTLNCASILLNVLSCYGELRLIDMEETP